MTDEDIKNVLRKKGGAWDDTMLGWYHSVAEAARAEAEKVCIDLAADSVAKASRMGAAGKSEAMEVARIEQSMGLACAEEIRALSRSPT